MLKRGALDLCKSISSAGIKTKVDSVKNFSETIKERGFDKNKTEKYLRQGKLQLEKGRKRDFRNRFGLMVKSGEEYYVDHVIDQSSETQVWDANSGNTGDLISKASDRARLIFVPLKEMCGLL